MSANGVSLVLPFSIQSENRKEPISEAMEMAVVFCMAELERQKGGGLIMKQAPERIEFISKALFPLILVDWDEQDLAFDALGTVTHIMKHRILPDINALSDNIRTRSKTQEAFMAFLSESIEQLKEPMNERATTLNGLITDPRFLEEFNAYFSEAKQTGSSTTDYVVMPATLDEDAITSAKHELGSLRREFKEELENLHSGLKLLSKAANAFVKTIRTDMKQIQEKHAEEIQKQENVIKPVVDKLKDDYDNRTTAISRDFGKQALSLHKEKIKLERTIVQTEGKMERYKLEAKAASVGKDHVAEKQWKEKAEEAKQRLSGLKKEKDMVEARIAETEEKKTRELFRVRSENEAKIAEAETPIFELEASRDAEVNFHKKQIEKLQSMTSALMEQINAMIKLRERDVDNLAKLGIRHRSKGLTALSVPFCLTCFQSEKSRRYEITVPSVAQSVGLSVKLKGALGKPRIMSFLSPRFVAISSFLGGVPLLFERNAALERDIHEEGGEKNILESSREQITIGMRQLLDEGWVSEKEHRNFVQLLE